MSFYGLNKLFKRRQNNIEKNLISDSIDKLIEPFTKSALNNPVNGGWLTIPISSEQNEASFFYVRRTHFIDEHYTVGLKTNKYRRKYKFVKRITHSPLFKILEEKYAWRIINGDYGNLNGESNPNLTARGAKNSLLSSNGSTIEPLKPDDWEQFAVEHHVYSFCVDFHLRNVATLREAIEFINEKLLTISEDLSFTPITSYEGEYISKKVSYDSTWRPEISLDTPTPGIRFNAPSIKEIANHVPDAIMRRQLKLSS